MLLHKLAQAKTENPDRWERVKRSLLPVIASGNDFQEPISDKSVFDGIENLVKMHCELRASVTIIQKYEQDLKTIFHTTRQPEEDPLRQLSTSELIKRAYMMILEADRQHTQQTATIKRLQVVSERKTKEVRLLRERLRDADRTALITNIQTLRDGAIREVGQTDSRRRSAVEKLIEAYRFSEEKRMRLEEQVIKLKSIIGYASESQNECSRPSGSNLFMELIELREIVKKTVVDTFQKSVSDTVEPDLIESVPRLLPPRPRIVMDSQPYENASDDQRSKTDDFIDSLGHSFSDERLHDLNSP